MFPQHRGRASTFAGRLPLLKRRHDVILEITRTVGLRPQPESPGNRQPQNEFVLATIWIRTPGFSPRRVFERKVSVKPCLEVSTVRATHFDRA